MVLRRSVVCASCRARSLRPELLLSRGVRERVGSGANSACCHVGDGRVRDQGVLSFRSVRLVIVCARTVSAGAKWAMLQVPVRAAAGPVRAPECSHTLHIHMRPTWAGPNPHPERYVAARGHGDLLNALIVDS